MSRRSWAFDVAVAAVVLVLGQLEAWWGVNATHRQGPHWAEALVYAGTALVLVFRRVDPLGVLVVMGLLYTAEFVLVGSPEGNGVALPPVIAVYTAARWEDRRARAWAALGVVLLIGLSWTAFDPVTRTLHEHVLAMMWFSPYVIGWLAGRSSAAGSRPPSSAVASASSGPPGRSPRSATGSPASCTTSSGTASA